ncbi:MAG: hypothetical protein WA777_08490 [Rhodanobacter sp.]
MNAAVITSKLWLAVLPTVAQAEPVIPYRTESPVSAGTVVVAILATVFVLTALIGVLMYARRRGWVPSANPGRPSASVDGIQLQASRRLSMLTTAHVVAYHGHAYLIVESGRGSSATVAALGSDADPSPIDKPGLDNDGVSP